MVRIYVSDVIDAPIEEVWGIIRDFNALPVWLPAAVTSEIEGGKHPAAIGCIRRVIARDNAIVREMLTDLSDVDYRCSYTIVSAPYPMRDYSATFTLHPVTDTGFCYMTWLGVFNVDAGLEQSTAQFVGDGIYGRAFAKLKQVVASG